MGDRGREVVGGQAGIHLDRAGEVGDSLVVLFAEAAAPESHAASVWWDPMVRGAVRRNGSASIRVLDGHGAILLEYPVRPKDYHAAMTRRATPVEWLIFLILAFCWGSSYLFIKLAVDDFGTFTLVALRLAVGAMLLWAVVLLSRVELPRDRRMYGHLAVMGAINIAVPFALITWAERSADSSLAAILTSPVPLFAAVLAPFFLPDEPIRVNGLAGLALGFIGVVILVSPGLSGSSGELTAMLALLGAAASYACGAIYARRNVRGLRPMVPAVFQVTFAGLYTLVLAFLIERPLSDTPDAEAIFSILWLGLLGSGLAYLCFFRLLGPWGATRLTMVAYVIPVIGIALGFLVLDETIDGRVVLGTLAILAGIAIVNGRYGRRRVFGRQAPPETTGAPGSV